MIALPNPHHIYLRARRLLFQPLLYKTLEISLQCCLLRSSLLNTSTTTIISRVIHIVTLQLHCQAEVAAFDLSERQRDEEGFLANNKDPVLQNIITKMADESTSGSHSPPDHGQGAASNYFQNSFKLLNVDSLKSSIPSTSISPSSGSNFAKDDIDLDREVVDDRETVGGEGRGLLTALADVWLAGLIRDDEYYHQGLSWLLQQLSAKSEDARILLLEKGITFEAAKAAQVSRDAMAKRRMEAQKKALLAMSKQAASFASTATSLSDDEEEEKEETGVEAPVICSLEDGSPNCIFCREKNGEAMGYLAFLQPSSVVRCALERHSDCKELQSVYRVVSLKGCEVTAAAAEGSKVKGHVSHGDHVLIKSRAGRWMRIVSPVKGWIPLYRSLSEPESLQDVEKKNKLLYNNYGLLSQKTHLEVILHPVTDLQFNRFGGVRLHASTCGHAMHVKCHENVLNTIRNSAMNRTHYEGSQAIDARRGEILCPLCKGIANTILPHVPPHIARSRLPMTSSEVPPPSSQGENSESIKSKVNILKENSAPDRDMIKGGKLDINDVGVSKGGKTLLHILTSKDQSQNQKYPEFIQSLLGTSSSSSSVANPLVDSTMKEADGFGATGDGNMGGMDVNDVHPPNLHPRPNQTHENKDIIGTSFRQHIMTHFTPSWFDSPVSSSASKNVHRMIISVEQDIEVSTRLTPNYLLLLTIIIIIITDINYHYHHNIDK